MSLDAEAPDVVVAPPVQARRPRRARPRREVIYRHAVLVRLTHWVNALAIFLLIGSGLNIFDAYPRLNWGRHGDSFDAPWLAIQASQGAHGPRGVAHLGPIQVDTTGWLGWFPTAGGGGLNRAWPPWLTIPSFQDLADARHWHFLFAWVLVVNGAVYLVWSLASRHLWRDLRPTLGDLRAIPRSVLDHIKLKHPVGEEAKRYNVLQRLAYLGFITLAAGMVATGLTMSPRVDAAAPWLLGLFGGRASARSLHFIFASLIVAFIVVHLVEVVLAGPVNEVWSMISGRYRVPADPHAGGEDR